MKTSELNLQEIAIFEGVDEKYIEEFLASGKLIDLKAGDYLFHQNDIGDTMYIIQSGKLQITVSEKNPTNNLPSNKVLGNFESGVLIGELCVFGQVKRSASISALTDAKLLKFDGEDFRIRIYSKELDALLICYNIAKVLSQRLYTTDSKL